MTPDHLRLIAGVVGALALVAVGISAAGGPAAALRLLLVARSVPAVAGDTKRALDDMRFVLELASRLSAAGNVDAVKLCQQLLDEMLRARTPEPPRPATPVVVPPASPVTP